MDTLVAQLSGSSRLPYDAEGSDYAGMGNLNSKGLINGMALPPVADVRIIDLTT